MKPLHILAATVLVVAIPTARAEAQSPPEIEIRRLDQAPIIDGRIAPGEWDAAARIDDFRQVDPVEGAPPSEKTEVFLGFDDNFVYIAYICHDSDPGAVITTTRERDARLDPDDRRLALAPQRLLLVSAFAGHGAVNIWFLVHSCFLRGMMLCPL